MRITAAASHCASEPSTVLCSQAGPNSVRSELEARLRGIPAPLIAVSGGVDSLTLAALAAELADDMIAMHAVSPAVPAEATQRVRRLARQRGWELVVLHSGEFEDPRYRANPIDRCFHCKTNLYAAMRRYSPRQILSGANLDDLREYRPGLEAAHQHGVRHPYIEAGIDKSGVRQIAHELGLPELAALPASPCLSSRVETGIRIEAATLSFIHRVEQLVAQQLQPAVVRCRIRASAIVIELDRASLASLGAGAARQLTQQIHDGGDAPDMLPIRFEAYRSGSAFVPPRALRA
jgi:uncharacterized protein